MQTPAGKHNFTNSGDSVRGSYWECVRLLPHKSRLQLKTIPEDRLLVKYYFSKDIQFRSEIPKKPIFHHFERPHQEAGFPFGNLLTHFAASSRPGCLPVRQHRGGRSSRFSAPPYSCGFSGTTRGVASLSIQWGGRKVKVTPFLAFSSTVLCVSKASNSIALAPP